MRRVESEFYDNEYDNNAKVAVYGLRPNGW